MTGLTQLPGSSLNTHNNSRIINSIVIAILAFTALAWYFTRVEILWPWYGGVYPTLDPDTLLYLRWLEQSLLQGKLLTRDLYMTFPTPYDITFSPLYREFLYRISLLFYLIPGTEGLRVESFLGLLPPLAGFIAQVGLSISLLYRKTPLIFVIFCAFAMLPGFSHFMTFDYHQLDHHWIEALCIGLWLICGDCYCSSAKYADKKSLSYFSVAGGIIMAVFITVWNGSPLFAALISLLAFIEWVLEGNEAMPLAEYASDALLIGAGLGALYVAKNPPLPGTDVLTGLGWGQPGLIAMAGLGLRILSVFRKHWPCRRFGRLLLAAVFVILGLLCSYVFFPIALQKAADFFAEKNPVISSISELQTAFKLQNLAKMHGQLIMQMTYWGIFPLFIGLPLIWLSKIKGFIPGKLMVEFALITYIMALYQIRYTRWLVVAFPILTAVVFYELFVVFRKGFGREAKWSVALAFFPFLLINVSTCYDIASVAPTVSKTQMQALAWLRDKTPETSGYADEKMPEYGVVNFWDQGNAITYYARRPVVVSNTQLGLKRMCKVLFANNETETYKYCLENKLRYLYLTCIPSNEYEFRYFSHLAESDDDSIAFNFQAPQKLADPQETWKTLYFWLFGSLGLKKFGPDQEISRHFRIVYVSPDGTNGKNSSIKIAQVVPGAIIKGYADPHTEVQLNLEIMFGKKPRGLLGYVRNVKADASGSFRFIVPYPTLSVSGGVRTGEYVITRIKEGKSTKSIVKVSEKAVLGAAEVAIE